MWEDEAVDESERDFDAAECVDEWCQWQCRLITVAAERGVRGCWLRQSEVESAQCVVGDGPEPQMSFKVRWKQRAAETRRAGCGKLWWSESEEVEQQQCVTSRLSVACCAVECCCVVDVMWCDVLLLLLM